MPKSKKNKDRKDNLTKFKNQQKHKSMSETNNTNTQPEIRQIRQVPIWTQDSKFELTGGEFMALQNFFNIYAEPVQIMQQIFSRHLNSGTIQIRYQDPEGREIPKQEVEDYLKQMQEYIASQAATAVASESTPETTETPKKLRKSKTVTEDTSA